MIRAQLKEILQIELRSLVLKEHGCYLFDLEHWIVRSGEMSQWLVIVTSATSSSVIVVIGKSEEAFVWFFSGKDTQDIKWESVIRTHKSFIVCCEKQLPKLFSCTTRPLGLNHPCWQTAH